MSDYANLSLQWLAAKETKSVLADLKQLQQTIAQIESQLAPLKARIEAKGKNLSAVWKAVEWWDSRDISEQDVLDAIAKFQAAD